MINSQLSKQGICWPVSFDGIVGSGVDPSRSMSFEVICWHVNCFQMIAGSSLIVLKLIWNMLCLCAAQLTFWFQTDLRRENPASYYRQGRQLVLPLLTMVTCLSRSTSSFYPLIGENLTGEFMRKIYAASWILFTLTAESTCDVFYLSFSTGCTKWNSAAIRNVLLFMASLFMSLVEVGNPISDGIVFVFRLAWCVEGWKVWSDTSGLTWYLLGLHLEW